VAEVQKSNAKARQKEKRDKERGMSSIHGYWFCVIKTSNAEKSMQVGPGQSDEGMLEFLVVMCKVCGLR